MQLINLVATGLFLAAGMVSAAPQAICVVDARYKDVVVTDPYELPPKMATGQTCNAYEDRGCELAMSVGYTV